MNAGTENFSANLRLCRTQKGWSQRRLAIEMTSQEHSMHQTTVAKIESASRPVTIDEAITLCELLHVRLADMLTSPEVARGKRMRELEAEMERVKSQSVR